jgi:hypothetical protein
MTTTCAFRCDAVYPASRRKRRLLGDVELSRARVLPTRIIRQHMPLQAGSRLGPYEILSLAWTRDGTAVIYHATEPTSNFGFWRVTIDGNHAPERIETGGDPGATHIARRRHLSIRSRWSVSTGDRVHRLGHRSRIIT